MIRASFVVNGQTCNVTAHPMKRLLDVLREDLRLAGTKEGCGEGECGACTVLIDGVLALSCLVPICQVQQKTITTIEGLGADGRIHPVQQAFLENGGAQCGICTPGMIIAAAYYVQHPEEAEDIQEALSGNQCRCTGYMKIFESVKAAMKVNG
ncbi:MAG: (2Fe-2S)-binding protein [Acidobacteria bacterium]|nr:(2Fe-2S)-binding protein [Acidobacteriota bacterium]